MSSARRRESSAGDGPSVAAGSKLDGAGGSSSDFDGEEFSLSQHWTGSKKTMDWESDNSVESEGSAGPPSLTSTSPDDDEEYTYRQKFVEEETAKE